MENASEYEDLPLNGLATTADIIEEQMRLYGITLNDNNTFSDLTQDTTSGLAMEQAFPDQLQTTQAPVIDGITPDPTDTSDPTATDAAATQTATPYVYDGPADMGKTFGDILASYGIPTSVSSLVTKAEEAFVGIPDDIQKGEESILTIMTKETRLQGIGAAFIIVAVIIGIVQALL